MRPPGRAGRSRRGRAGSATTSAPARAALHPGDRRTEGAAAEGARNARDPQKVALACSEDSVRRNRGTFVTGRAGIVECGPRPRAGRRSRLSRVPG
ncbi:DUF1348 family protein [Streptomyces sp. NPDC047706]|uniref:DUF1348 family protein n=1 Tax=Streptomyces sp. NPDC047706 TaxID=3365486 RepID=UPI003710B95D